MTGKLTDPGNNYAILDNLIVTVEVGIATGTSTWGQIKAIFR